LHIGLLHYLCSFVKGNNQEIGIVYILKTKEKEKKENDDNKNVDKFGFEASLT